MRTSAVLFTVLAITAMAGADATFSWENNAQGWQLLQFPAPRPLISSFSTTVGVTDGSYSAIIPGGSAWGWYTGLDAGAYKSLFAENTRVELDITIVDPLTPELTKAAMWQIAADGWGAGTDTNPTPLSMGTNHVVFDYGSIVTPPASYGWVWLKLGFSGNYAGDIYIDNLRFTPEPATMGLLGVGALALLRRRK